MQPDSIHYSGNRENYERRRPRLYINRKTPLVTYILVAVTVLVFLADQALKLVIGYPLLTLLGAKLNSAIIAGQWWRLVTPMFLHADFFHILFNMFALVIWGRQLEALMGRARYIAVYFLSGILGCMASFAFSNSLSVGASGAVFGLFGALLYFRREHREIFNAVFGVQVLVIIGINIANGFLVANIDNFGHLGGLAGGFIACGITGFYGQRQSAVVRYGCLLGYSALFLGFFALRYYGIT
ncbi:MAG: rhomboid family intramembrane serine protease [Christensenellales bacterium]|jgi:rhomboid protease GluP